MNVIMLDIDGPVSYYDNMYEIDYFAQDHTAWHPEAVECLDNIAMNVAELKFVLTSTWRKISQEHNTIDWWNQQFILKGAKHIEFVGITGISDNSYRGREVNNWLLHTQHKVEKYLCIDDDSDFYYYQPLYLTRGLRDSDFEEISNFFNCDDKSNLHDCRHPEWRKINNDETSLTWK